MSGTASRRVGDFRPMLVMVTLCKSLLYMPSSEAFTDPGRLKSNAREDFQEAGFFSLGSIRVILLTFRPASTGENPPG